MTYEDICKANATIQPMTITRRNRRTGEVTTKDYAEVNQRIKAFRMLYPEGFILTEMVSNEDKICVMRAKVGYYDPERGHVILATGTAYEKETPGTINETSYIENCETSAVGRALGMLALGIDTAVASYEEVQNAVKAQDAKQEPKEERKIEAPTADPLILQEITMLAKKAGVQIEKVLAAAKAEKLEDMSPTCAASVKKSLQRTIQKNATEAQDARETA